MKRTKMTGGKLLLASLFALLSVGMYLHAERWVSDQADSVVLGETTSRQGWLDRWFGRAIATEASNSSSSTLTNGGVIMAIEKEIKLLNTVDRIAGGDELSESSFSSTRAGF